MWPQILFLIFYSALYFRNFMSKYFSNVSFKVYSFFTFGLFYKFRHMSFIFLQKIYTDLLYLNIIVQVNLL